MKIDAYLWDGSGEPDPEVERLEALLADFRSTAEAPDVELPAAPAASTPHVVELASRRRIARFAPLAAAAAVALAATSGLVAWRMWTVQPPMRAGGPAPGTAQPQPAVGEPADRAGTAHPGATATPEADDAVAPNLPPPVHPRDSRGFRGAVRVAAAAPVLPVPDAPPATVPRRDSPLLDATTAMHVEQAQILLRSFRNTSPDDVAGLAYDSRRSRELLTANAVLRRVAAVRGRAPAHAVLSEIEPYLIDIANLDARAPERDVRTVQDRVERSSIVADLQLYARSGPAIGY